MKKKIIIPQPLYAFHICNVDKQQAIYQLFMFGGVENLKYKLQHVKRITLVYQWDFGDVDFQCSWCCVQPLVSITANLLSCRLPQESTDLSVESIS